MENIDVDYDEEATDNEDDEVREARVRIDNEKKKEVAYVNEIECLHRVAQRKGKVVQVIGSDYEGHSSDFDRPPKSHDEDDCGYLLPQLVAKKSWS
ncbi:Calpain-5 [Bienertia sinuspersici]